jgi:peptidoglycan/xylan/chitin deacetylase (PgdA/CDA1 family)
MNKYYLEKVARILAPPLYYSQLHRLTKPIYGGMGQILMFHRVLPSSGKLRIHNHKSLEITPQHLESIIEFFKKRGYEFISLDDLLAYKNSSTRSNRKFVVFTFDDGYVDNYLYAYPIFKKHNVPFTIYVATSLPDSKATLWWYLLEDMVVNRTSVKMEVEGKEITFRTETIKEKEIAFNKIRYWFALADEKNLPILLSSLFRGSEEEIAAKTRELSLTWQQIYELSQDPLVTIGSHTVNHLPLDSLTAEKSTYEILESKKIIESHISKEVKHFCYPLGSHGRKEIEILAKTSYATATTIKMANIFAENLYHPFALPRIMINSLTNDRILDLQVNGLLPALRNKFRRVVI